MFDIGFSELMVIALVALVVIGPERLPGVARTVGHLMGRLQRYIADVKADIDREIELGDLRKMRDSFQEAASEVETTVRKELSQHQKELNEAAGAAAPATHGEEGGGAPETAPEPATPPTIKAAHEERAEAPSAPAPAAQEEAAREAVHEERVDGPSVPAPATHEEAPREAAPQGAPAGAVPAASTPAATPETR